VAGPGAAARRALVLLNPSGGSAGDDPQPRVAAALAAARVDRAIEVTDGAGLAARSHRAVDDGVELVIAAGGDGTISAVAGALAGTTTTLGIMPLGTLNHFARDLAIPFDLDEAAAVIGAGHAQAVDVASVNGRILINNSAVGLYPLMVADRDRQQLRSGRSKRLAMLVASARALVRFHHHRLTLDFDGGDRESVLTPLLFVGNNDYRLDGAAAGQRESLVDGKLCVVVLRRKGRIGLVAALVRALTGRTREADMLKYNDVIRLKVGARRALLRVSCDGESIALAPPLDYTILPGALQVIAPA
jgi:YegS/Rv2252/BmrU family lipid kinase